MVAERSPDCALPIDCHHWFLGRAVQRSHPHDLNLFQHLTPPDLDEGLGASYTLLIALGCLRRV